MVLIGLKRGAARGLRVAFVLVVGAGTIVMCAELTLDDMMLVDLRELWSLGFLVASCAVMLGLAFGLASQVLKAPPLLELMIAAACGGAITIWFVLVGGVIAGEVSRVAIRMAVLFP